MPDGAWQLPDFEDAEELSALHPHCGLSPVALRILAGRGMLDQLEDSRWDGAHEAFVDPFDLPDMERAAERISRAVDRGERVVVHGDYDVDGISGTALLTGGLRRLGAVVQPFVPDRIKDGYGVADRLVERAGEAGVKVLITVDTGSSARTALGRARELGIDVVVCDHHLLEPDPPAAFALINPHRSGHSYPHTDLCGCAVAWKLLGAVHQLRNLDQPLRELDLVALATVADQVPLRGENRALVRAGLEILRERPRPGLGALLEVSRLSGVEFDESYLAFQLAPRINATGRIETPRTALALLLAEDGGEARRLAARTDDLNRQRRSVQQRVSAAAKELAQRRLLRGESSALVLADPAWHFGVVGISAAQVAGDFDRPTVLLAVDGSVARGSARSARGVDLKAALDGCSDLLLRHGGHAAAAGLQIDTSKIDAFATRFEEVVAQMPQDLGHRGPRVDAVARLGEIDRDFVDFQRRLGPFGNSNPEPRLLSRDLRIVSARTVGADHLRLQLSDGSDCRDFIGFSMAERWSSELRGASGLDVIYSVRYREGSPFDPWQLQVHALRASTSKLRTGEAG